MKDKIALSNFDNVVIRQGNIYLPETIKIKKIAAAILRFLVLYYHNIMHFSLVKRPSTFQICNSERAYLSKCDMCV